MLGRGDGSPRVWHTSHLAFPKPGQVGLYIPPLAPVGLLSRAPGLEVNLLAAWTQEDPLVPSLA